MNKTELIAKISERTNLTKKDAANALAAVTDILSEQMKAGDAVQLIGFGTFTSTEKPSRKVRNPKTGEMIETKACKAPRFKPGKGLKDFVNN